MEQLGVDASVDLHAHTVRQVLALLLLLCAHPPAAEPRNQLLHVLCRYHVQKAEEHGSVCLKYRAMCQQLVSEQEVQALAIDAARVNVEHHYQYICGSYGDFMDRWGCSAFHSSSRA